MNALVGFLKHFFTSALHKEKRDWEIIFYCLGTSCLFWFLHSMGKVYQHPVRVPVVFQYPAGQVLPISSLPQHISVLAEGRGWDLARTMLVWDHKPIRIPIKRPLETTWMLPQSWNKLVKNNLPLVRVEAVLEDTLFCRFDRIEKKLVGLYVDLKDIQLKSGYQIASPIVITPRFIEFSGAATLVRSLPDQLPVRIDARNISQNFDKNISIDFSDEYPKNELLSYVEESVNVQFSVRPTLEEELQVPIHLKNENLYPGLKLIEREAMVTFLISERDKALLRQDDFEVVADLETFNAADSTVVVKLVSKPNFVSDVQLGTQKTKVYAP